MFIIKAAYAELLVSGKKARELRKRNTNFRGKFLIHAEFQLNDLRIDSLGFDKELKSFIFEYKHDKDNSILD